MTTLDEARARAQNEGTAQITRFRETVRIVVLGVGVVLLAIALTIAVTQWTNSKPDRDDYVTDYDPDSGMPRGKEPPLQVVTLKGATEVTVNRNGECEIKWGFEGLVDIIDPEGHVMTVQQTDIIPTFWTEKVRSTTGDPVVFHYQLVC